MVDPEFFRVEYAINPHMVNESGELNKVDRKLAVKQWLDLKSTYEKLGYKVEVLKGREDLPDMVFSANQSFPFWDEKKNAKSVVLSNMYSPERQPEVELFRNFYETQGYRIYELKGEAKFEGNGDALIQPGKHTIWGGFGYRTEKEAYLELSERFGFSIVPLKLISPDFYHLDTCFSIINSETAMYLPSAFEDESIKKIQSGFQNVIELDSAEALKCFTGNCHSPNGKDIVVQSGAGQFKKDMLDRGFRVYEVDTSEYLKSGGSVFCLKMMYY